eukprot:CAMPEP_0119532086 /NCGR_PEP_ID=MMETSP1344-20130328/45670_1 /TAXON_ID=236787 /ORGANISM="Florenciella parvula, Strain CCMP2471" /LENGTH=39 /DNA_ID= /DNA_START= /DNA_END= /DNA_ORIENTATION=
MAGEDGTPRQRKGGAAATPGLAQGTGTGTGAGTTTTTPA